MTTFVELWTYLSTTPLFGLTATLSVYVLAHAFYTTQNQATWANPVLWSVVALACLLALTGTAYPTYFSGAQFIHVLLGPAVVALGWPLWQRRHELSGRWQPLLFASLAGGAAAAGSAVALGWALGLPDDVLRSLAPKSVTAPVAMGIADTIGGIPALAAVVAVVTGLVGAVSAGPVFNWLGIGTSGADWQTRGFAVGTTSHGIGAAHALQTHPDAGAYAGLALGMQAVLASVLMPLLARWF
jgi:putative effector of murein hydrolase